MSRTILYTEYGVEFSKNEHDEHFLSVLVGGVAQYEVTIRLTPEELSAHREFGDYYIQKLGTDICDDPSRFRDRHVDAA